MTGFARIQGQQTGISWTWEVRAVNGRGLDIRFRLPAGLSQMEEGLRKQVRSRFKRGNMQISLQLEHDREAESAVSVNIDLARQIVEEFAPLVEQGLVRRTSVDGLIAVKNVLQGKAHCFEEAELSPSLFSSFTELLDQLALARANEGRELSDSLGRILDKIEILIGQCRNNPALRPEVVLENLHKQVKVLNESIAPERLAQEAALLAIKADINEELERLQGHVSAARELLGIPGPAGRKLEFLSQELSREVNTLCAKSNNSQLTGAGLELKTLIDQIKEQAANVE